MKKYLLLIFLNTSLLTQSQINHYNFFSSKTAYSAEPPTQWKSTCQVINDNKGIIIKKFSKEAINLKYNKDGLVDSTYKAFYYSKDTTVKKKNGIVYYIREQLNLDEVTTEEVESKIIILDSIMYYFNKYEIEQYTQTKKQISSKFNISKAPPKNTYQKTIYKANYWADIKGKGDWAKAMENPTFEKIEIIKSPETFIVKFGTKVSNYSIVSENKFSEVKIDYLVTLNGKKYTISIMDLSKSAFANPKNKGTFSINIEGIWMVPEIKDVELK